MLSNVHRLVGAGESAASAGADFDDYQRGAVKADEIQFAQPATIALDQYPQAVPLQVPGRALFPGEPAFGSGGGLT